MIKTSWIEQVRWIKPKPKRESPIHEDRPMVVDRGA